MAATAILMAVFAAVAGPTDSEVVQVERLARLITIESERREAVAPELAAALAESLELSARRILSESGVLAEADAGGPEFHELLRAFVANRLLRIPVGARARRRALDALMRQATTRPLAVAFLDEWFGLAPPAEHEQAGSVGPGLLAQVRASAASGPLVINGEQFVLDGEVDAATVDNGLIDVGEWISLSFPLVNKAPLPWFSSSARAIAEGGCLWVDSAPHLLPELAPGGAATLRLVIYVAGDCTLSDRRSLVVQVDDTHRGTTGSLIRLDLSPMLPVRPQLANARLDVDGLGSSDGSNAAVIGPGLQAEFSVDVLSEARVSSAREAFSIPTEFSKLFSRFDHRADAVLVDDGKGTLRAGDDVDIAATQDEAFVAVIGNATNSGRWMRTGKTGKLWVAVDLAINVPLPARNEGPKSVGPSLSVAAKPLRLKLEAASAPTSLSETVDEDAVATLVQQHLSVVPHPDPTQLPNALRAFSGYEVVFDREGFAKAYGQLHQAQNVAPDNSSAGRAVASYVVRLYQVLPTVAVLGVPHAALIDSEASEVPEPLEPLPREALPPAVPRDERPLFRVDVGVGANIDGHAVGDQELRPFGTNALVVRGLIGADFAGLVGGGFAFGQYDSLAGVADVSIQEIEAEAGGAYRIALSPFEVTPYLSAALQRRALSDPASGVRRPRDSAMLNLGVMGRFNIYGVFGAYADVAFRLAQPGPAIAGDDVVSGLGARVNGGVSFAF